MKRILCITAAAMLLLSICFALAGCGPIDRLKELNAVRITPTPSLAESVATPPAPTPEAQAAVIETVEEPAAPASEEAGLPPADMAAEPAAEPAAEDGAGAIPEPAAEAVPDAVAVTAPEPPAPLPDIDINSFEFLLANSYNSIGMEYAPPYANFEGQGIDARIVEPATAFVNAAREACTNVWVSAAFRNSEFLNSWYLSYFNNVYHRDAVETANHFLAQGIDEHQTGLAIDFTDVLYRAALYEIFDDPEMQETELYEWAVEHCAEYGFILRYPEGKEQYYGVACRHPAHFRYVGEEAARYIMDNDLCLEEFLMMYDGNKVFLPAP